MIGKLLRDIMPDMAYSLIREREFRSLGLVGMDDAACADKLSFLDTENFIGRISSNTVMLLTTEDFFRRIEEEGSYKGGYCLCDKPRLAFFKLHNYLAEKEGYKREPFPTEIGKNCHIHPSASIAEKNVRIGNNVTIEEFVVIRENTEIGDNTILRTGVKVGCPDFEYKKDGDRLMGVTHAGGVIIGHDVEVLANTGINKAVYPWDNTVVGDDSKIDMLCNISHGVKIGKECMVVALSGIGGRTVIGDRCWIGYGAIVRNGIRIGEDARVNMGAVVSRSVEAGCAVTGNFAIDHDIFMEALKKKAGGGNAR